MKLDNSRKCDKCGQIYSVAPFANMLGNGELAYSTINIHGDDYDLCPRCTYKIWSWLNAKDKEEL